MTGIDKNVRTSSRGEYWRLLVPGTYTVFARAEGFQPSLPEIVDVPLVWPPIPVVKHFKLYKVEMKKKNKQQP